MSTERKLEQCAQVLFDAEPHTALAEVYKQSNKQLSWSNAPSQVKAHYIKKAKECVKQLGYSV